MEQCYVALLSDEERLRFDWFYFYSEHKAGSNANKLDCLRAMTRKKGYAFVGNHNIEVIYEYYGL
ncbi:hypothetical protein DDV21_001125 [Streptococcus chenjunshii]|uniref:Uncharacterized protein n=1 Tax=Streptococcus chenjunshii TaxID=2173853 RepID=A0A372KK87_9STRE|nr:hypothetical protein [Streptococcus chenjunshii]AXQ77772.1 hypothetical protein DDV21_001125 [Streptococcus chenjunshii]RFU50494.1 hypothetical protein DDV22_08460 [Streptococcus chenjunshii]RFU52722.1 hypothetical protein DDV23_08300 [Streptococcus chenjunshii]